MMRKGIRRKGGDDQPGVDFGKNLFVIRIIIPHELAIFDAESVTPKGEVADCCRIFWGWVDDRARVRVVREGNPRESTHTGLCSGIGNVGALDLVTA